MAARANDGTYCSTLTDAQVLGVIDAEKKRIQGLAKESEVRQAAEELLQEARLEAAKRGLAEEK